MAAFPQNDSSPEPAADVRPKAGDGVPRRPDGTRLPDRIAIHTSKPKMLLLILPCLLAIAVTLQADSAGRLEFADFAWVRVAAVVIALLVAAQLLRMAFESAPVLVLDAEGLHCRRPPIGTVAWTAITAIGAGKATLMRRVLMVAVDVTKLGEPARSFANRSSGFANLISPQLGRFGAQTRGSVVFQIPITLLAMSTNDIERITEAFALAHIPEE